MVTYSTHRGVHSLVSPLRESHKGVWVNKKLGSMMGWSICEHLSDSRGKKAEEWKVAQTMVPHLEWCHLNGSKRTECSL